MSDLKAKDINDKIGWKDLTLGCVVFESGTAELVNTGDWRTMKPVIDMEKCKQCMLCVPVCPDMSIPVEENGNRGEFNYFFCKGCGICAKVCPFDAITMIKDEK